MHTLKPAKSAKSYSKRVGRGNASGKGTYSARGIKGQKARTGGRGGLKAMGLRRIVLSTPKRRGFRSLHPRAVIVTVDDLGQKVKDGEIVNVQRLVALGFIDRADTKVKILGGNTFAKKITVQGIPVSESARKMILDAGGTIVEHRI